MKKLDKEDQKEMIQFLKRLKNNKNLCIIDTAKKEQIRKNMRSNLHMSLKKNKNIGNTEYYLGCTITELKEYLESKFQPGMTWDNKGYHGWHLDHIKPLFLFNVYDDEELKKAGHYTNLQPVWYKDHRQKTKIEKQENKTIIDDNNSRWRKLSDD